MEMLEQRPAQAEIVDYDREQRLYDDTTTWLAEVLDGSMRTPFEYRFDGKELYGQDGSALAPIFDKAIEDAAKLTLRRPDLAFELRRRKIERTEYDEMIAMAKGDLPNTMIVVSDFPEELMDAPEDVGGYNVSRKQTMLRVISRSDDGTISMRSQSLDGSNREALEAMYDHLGFEPQSGELLGQRMHLDVAAEDQEFMIDWLMGAYDRKLQDTYGGEWYAGRAKSEKQNTYDFVCSQQVLIGAFMREASRKGGTVNDTLLYNLAAEMRRRYETKRVEPIEIYERIDTPLAALAMDAALTSMQIAGAHAKSEGRTFSGCGMSLSSKGGENSTESELGGLGLGNKAEESKEDDALPSTLRCVNCKEDVPSKQVVKKDSWCCPKCKYEVDVCTGKVLCKGIK